jgi:hypothetical protein
VGYFGPLVDSINPTFQGKNNRQERLGHKASRRPSRTGRESLQRASREKPYAEHSAAQAIKLVL